MTTVTVAPKVQTVTVTSPHKVTVRGTGVGSVTVAAPGPAGDPGSRVLVSPATTSGSTVATAIAALGAAGGEIVLQDGSHTWDAIPAIPPALTGRLSISTAPGAKIVLTAGAPRCFDWGKLADYDTFQHVDIGPLTADCDNIGGLHHVVIGPWQAGVWQRKINGDDIHVHDIRLENVPVGTDSGVDFRIGVHIGAASSVLDDNEITWTNCSVRRVWSDGCLQLVAIHGVPVGAEATANTFHDDIVVEDIDHDLPDTPTAANAGAHVMAGTKGTGGKITVRRVRGRNSSDVGVESGAWQDSTVDDCVVEDAFSYPYYHVNYDDVASLEAQLLTFEKCVSRRRLIDRTGTANTGFKIDVAGGRRPASVHFGPGCLHHRMATSAGVEQQWEAVDILGSRRVTGEVEAIVELPAYNGAGNISPSAIRIRSDDVAERTIVDLKARVKVTGSQGSTGLINWRSLLVREGLIRFVIDLVSEVTLTGSGNASIIDADIGATAGAATLSGRVRVDCVPGSRGNTPIGIQFESGAINTIASNEEIVVHDSVMSGLAATSTDVNFTGATTLAAGTRFEDNKWRTAHQSRRAVAADTTINTRWDLTAVTSTAAPRTLTLPAANAVPVGKVFTVKDESGGAAANNITVAAAGADTIEGAATVVIAANYGSVRLYSTGAAWLLAA